MEEIETIGDHLARVNDRHEAGSIEQVIEVSELIRSQLKNLLQYPVEGPRRLREHLLDQSQRQSSRLWFFRHRGRCGDGNSAEDLSLLRLGRRSRLACVGVDALCFPPLDDLSSSLAQPRVKMAVRR